MTMIVVFFLALANAVSIKSFLSSTTSQFFAGAAKVDATPPLGVPLAVRTHTHTH